MLKKKKTFMWTTEKEEMKMKYFKHSFLKKKEYSLPVIIPHPPPTYQHTEQSICAPPLSMPSLMSA